MKKLALLALLAFAVMGSINLTSSADGVYGFIYTNATVPGGGSGSVTTPKVGHASCVSYFGIVALGDCSIQTAAKQGKINNLSHYDTEIVNILGFSKVKTYAYGQ
ncbi:MAG: TRL domain-containing protein [Vampirovibrionales bacterium]|jgi:hypothetical protein